MAVRGKKWILVKHFEGFPKDSDVKLVEFELPPLKDGEVLLEAEFLTVDPYMRAFVSWMKEGDVIMGESVARVIESCNSNYPVGTWTRPNVGWTTHSISDCTNLTKLQDMPPEVPRSYGVGALGMPGVAAYFGLLDICKPKAGETILVSTAAGAVGSIVGQIAKIKGCRVIGCAGSEAKLAFLKDIGYDEVFNYKTITDLDATLKALAPEGFDIYFDNVGGQFATTVIQNMREYGRVCCCGSTSTYNHTQPEKVDPIYVTVLSRNLKIEGYTTFSRYMSRYPEAISQLSQWISEGKIKAREHVTEGFENMFKAFQGLFTGENIGKAIVKV